MLTRLAATSVAICLALPAAAQELSLNQISAYLNSVTTAEADFTQINDDGSISKGKLFIKRPGRVRFEYDPPNKSLVLAGAGEVAVFDEKSNQPPERYPLSKTPLNLILERNVDLNRHKMVVGKISDGKTTSVTAQDPDHPDYGTIRLVFTGNPVELRQWVVTDSSGAQTTVILGKMTLGGEMSETQFDVQHEISRRGL